MRNLTTLIGPRLSDRLQLAALWGGVVGLSLVYWETCRLAHGAPSIDLHESGLRMVEIWSGWLVLSFPAFEWCRQWRASRAGLRLRHVLALMVTISLLALCCEWLLNALLSQHGGIERWESVWAMFNRRALLCVVVSSAIVWFAVRPGLVWRKPADSRPVQALRPDSRATTLQVMDRDQPVSVSLDDVEAILGAENYVQICMVSGKEYLHRTTLAGIERELDSGRMLRVHRSAIVNVDKVSHRLAGLRLQLTSGRTVRVGRTFREAFEQRMRDR